MAFIDWLISKFCGESTNSHQRHLPPSPEDVMEAIRADRRRMAEKRQDVEKIVRENAHEPGWLTENVDWMFIQEAGEYISPVGDDEAHTITLTKRGHRSTPVMIAQFQCSNSIYAEWVQCCCETMWHTKSKILKDMHGNTYPVGDLCEVYCSITY